jgi:hypothetical protein
MQRGRLQRLQFGIAMRGPDVLVTLRPPPGEVDDLHRRRTRRRLHRPQMWDTTPLYGPLSAQIRLPQSENPQVSPLRSLRSHDREPTQVVVVNVPTTRVQ